MNNQLNANKPKFRPPPLPPPQFFPNPPQFHQQRPIWTPGLPMHYQSHPRMQFQQHHRQATPFMPLRPHVPLAPHTLAAASQLDNNAEQIMAQLKNELAEKSAQIAELTGQKEQALESIHQRESQENMLNQKILSLQHQLTEQKTKFDGHLNKVLDQQKLEHDKEKNRLIHEKEEIAQQLIREKDEAAANCDKLLREHNSDNLYQVLDQAQQVIIGQKEQIRQLEADANNFKQRYFQMQEELQKEREELENENGRLKQRIANLDEGVAALNRFVAMGITETEQQQPSDENNGTAMDNGNVVNNIQQQPHFDLDLNRMPPLDILADDAEMNNVNAPVPPAEVPVPKENAAAKLKTPPLELNLIRSPPPLGKGKPKVHEKKKVTKKHSHDKKQEDSRGRSAKRSNSVPVALHHLTDSLDVTTNSGSGALDSHDQPCSSSAASFSTSAGNAKLKRA